MENIKDTLKKLCGIFRGNKKAKFFLIIGLLGFLLISFSEMFVQNEEKIEIEKTLPDSSAKEEILEERLGKIISEISGAGKTKVMVTVESSDEYFFAEDISEERSGDSFSRRTETVISEKDSSEEPIVIRTDEAKIRGVLIVCEGGENSKTREKIIEAVCALLDIPSNKVSVAEMA